MASNNRTEIERWGVEHLLKTPLNPNFKVEVFSQFLGLLLRSLKTHHGGINSDLPSVKITLFSLNSISQ